jgi:hypothetical protein
MPPPSRFVVAEPQSCRSNPVGIPRVAWKGHWLRPLGDEVAVCTELVAHVG